MFQVRDEYRTDFDIGRCGYGKIMSMKLEASNSNVPIKSPQP